MIFDLQSESQGSRFQTHPKRVDAEKPRNFGNFRKILEQTMLMNLGYENSWNKNRNAIRIAVACVILKNMRSNFQSAGKGGDGGDGEDGGDGGDGGGRKGGEIQLFYFKNNNNNNKQEEEEEELRVKARESVQKIMQNHLKLSLRVF